MQIYLRMLHDPPLWRRFAPTHVCDRWGKKNKQTNSKVSVLENMQMVNHLNHCLSHDVGIRIWELNPGKFFHGEKTQQETPAGCFNFSSRMFHDAAFACFLDQTAPVMSVACCKLLLWWRCAIFRFYLAAACRLFFYVFLLHASETRHSQPQVQLSQIILWTTQSSA